MSSAQFRTMHGCLQRLVFACGGTDFTVKDVLDGAWIRGELQDSWEQFLLGTACEERAVALGVETDDDLLQSMSEEFRYQRELLTAEETERWLAARDLT